MRHRHSCAPLAPDALAQAQTTDWIGGVGDMLDGSNWSSGVPFDGGPEFFIDNGGTARLTLSATSSYFSTGGSVGTGATDSGTIQLVWDTLADTATVQFSSTLSLGVSGQGTLAVLATPAENANDSGTNLELGVNAGGVGEMEVFSSFVRFDDAEIGIVGNATVEISDTEWYAEQQSLGVQAQSRGFMTVSNGSNMTIEQSLGVGDGHLVVGSGGSGELQVTTISRLKTKVLKLGELALSSGVVSLNASDLKVDDDIFVGMAGSGTLTAIDSPIEANALYIARHAGSSGNVTFSARLLSLAADLHVGSGGNGRLTLSNNGLLLSDITNLGFEPGARGEIDVQEFTWDNARAIFVGVLGEGILKINSGGAVTSESGYLGQRGAGAGSVVMNGGNWTMTNTLGIGVNGRGSFEASGGAQVFSPWSQIGLNTGSGGEATLANATWSVGNTLTVASSGTGSLTVSTGGQLTAGAILVGSASGANGTINVTGGTITTDTIIAGGGAASMTFDNALLQLSNASQVIDTLLFDGFQSGSLVINSGGLELNTGSGNATVAASLSGVGQLTKVGAGRLRLATANPYAGGTQLEQGTLEISASGALGSGPMTMNTGELRANANATLSGSGGPSSITINPNANAVFSATPGETLTVAVPTVTIGSNVTFSGGSAGNTGNVIFSPGTLNAPTSLPALNVVAGRLAAGNTALEQLTTIAESTTVAAGATLDFQDHLTGTGIQALFGSGTVNTGSLATTVLSVNSGDFSGNISGVGQLIKVSPETLSLTGFSAATGGTIVRAGTLNVTGTLGGGFGDVEVETGGTLISSGTFGVIRLNGGTFSLGNTASTMNATGLLWSDGVIRFDLGTTPATSDLIRVGSLEGFGTSYAFTFIDQGMLAGTTYDLIEFQSGGIDVDAFTFTNTNGLQGDFLENGGILQFHVAVVPEPAAGSLIALTLFGLIAWRWFTRSRTWVPSIHILPFSRGSQAWRRTGFLD